MIILKQIDDQADLDKDQTETDNFQTEIDSQ